MRFGYFLSCEEYTPAQLIEQARLAQDAGFEALWISDHFHPWNDEQGQSPFVWSMIGAISQVCDLPVTTAVTCPTFRVHPAIIAQAAATASVLLDGKFTLGIGSGEALNEHILGERWPSADIRLAMLEESVEVMRQLWTGDVVTHEGTYYDVDTARIYTLPDQPVPVYVSAFGPKALDLACRIGDGFITTTPDKESLQTFRERAGADKGAHVGTKCTWASTKEEAVSTAHRLWANSGVPGELSQVLPSPRHFEQASTLVTPEMIGDSMPCGPDLDEHVEALQEFVDAGFEDIYVANIGPHYAEMMTRYQRDVIPALRLP